MTTIAAALLSRRHVLAGGAALALMPQMPGLARASAGMLGASAPSHYRFKLGGFEVTTLLAGARMADNPQGTFGMNASPEDFAAASAAAFIPADWFQQVFVPTVVNTGSELVLFDTGLNAEAITGALAAAGYTPDQVDVVVLTHMHGDHIGGLMGADGPTFANARYVAGATEYDNWAAAGNEGFDKNVRPLADRMTMLDDGGAALPGITAMAMPGHTPGHLGFMLDSDGQQLVLAADMTNHFVWSLAYPDWEVRFDADKARAAETRRRVLGMLAADRVPFVGYHMPFPGVGYVEAAGDGFRFVPATYQLMLNG